MERAQTITIWGRHWENPSEQDTYEIAHVVADGHSLQTFFHNVDIQISSFSARALRFWMTRLFRFASPYFCLPNARRRSYLYREPRWNSCSLAAIQTHSLQNSNFQRLQRHLCQRRHGTKCRRDLCRDQTDCQDDGEDVKSSSPHSP